MDSDHFSLVYIFFFVLLQESIEDEEGILKEEKPNQHKKNGKEKKEKEVEIPTWKKQKRGEGRKSGEGT